MAGVGQLDERAVGVGKWPPRRQALGEEPGARRRSGQASREAMRRAVSASTSR